jgi:lipopolysaccharide biosynthesis protein
MTIANEVNQERMPTSRRLIAFYLPQYHPIPENDRWWGRGFTEWTNVTRTHPIFPSHYQPHLPSDLGFYDLRVPEVRSLQAQLASQHGIYGFCYYHYWFQGSRLLERPFDEVLASGEPEFSFCLCWANEDWTRRWDGREGEVLMPQQYSHDDDRRHIRALLRAFEDPRYIRVADRPVFLVYHTARLPNPRATADIWREEARCHGFADLYLIKVENHLEVGIPPREFGFDAAAEFQPAWRDLGTPLNRSRFRKLTARVGVESDVYQRHDIYRYEDVVNRMLARPSPEYTLFPCVLPMFDNVSRRQEGAVIFDGSTPELYESWLRNVLNRFQPPTPDENLVFINAWNEWAEGNHLEPDQRWGRRYLEATLRASAGFSTTCGAGSTAPAVA